jgi:hypothetical protein
MNDVDINLDAGTEHPDRIQNTFLAIDKKVLSDDVNDPVFGREIDRLGILNRVFNIFLDNLPIMRCYGVKAAIIEAADMGAGDAQVNATDFNVGHLLGFNDGVANVFLGKIEIDNFTFANAARFSLTEPNDTKCARVINFAHDGTDFRCADVQTDNR